MLKRFHNIPSELGVGLIEVLVTMLLLSTALLTLASLQTRSLQYNQGAYFRSQANILAYDVLDRVRANKSEIANYNVALSAYAASSATSPVAAVDISQWQKDVDGRLPSAKSGLQCVASTKVCTVTIEWRELNGSGEVTEDTTQLKYMSRI